MWYRYLLGVNLESEVVSAFVVSTANYSLREKVDSYYSLALKRILQGLHTDGELVWPNAGFPLPCLAVFGIALL